RFGHWLLIRMNVVGKVGSLITQGVYLVATPFHSFGRAVDVIVVQQPDGKFRCTPWYVRFRKFQGMLKGAEKVVRINVNGVEAHSHMYLDNSGEAYFVKEVDDEDVISTGSYVTKVGDGTSGLLLETQRKDEKNCWTKETIVIRSQEDNHLHTVSEDVVSCIKTESVLTNCLELHQFAQQAGNADLQNVGSSLDDRNSVEESNANGSITDWVM
ncbi:unnamed protein product, partial [Sphenostylis stenocarpa]